MDRKALIREYKSAERPIGVFRVRCVPTGRWFLGSSPNLGAALNSQRFQLRLGAHRDKALQQDWTAHGEEAFEFETLDMLEAPDNPDYKPQDDLKQLEALWRDKLEGEPTGK